MQLLIKGGRVLDPLLGIDDTLDVLVDDGRVRRIAPRMERTGIPVLDAGGKLVVPGLVDMHVHLRDFGEARKETIASGTRAAAMGGFTTVVCEPNTAPPLDNARMLSRWCRTVNTHAVVSVLGKVCITVGSRGERLTRLGALSRRPWVAAASDDGNPVVSAEVMKRALQASHRHSLLLTPHCEESPASLRTFQGAHPSLQLPPDIREYRREPYYIERDLALFEKKAGRLHISHVSMKESVQLIRDAKARGSKVTCEATPHHLTLTEAARHTRGTDAKVNPPLRDARDRETLRTALTDGTIDVIASDHAPHTPEEKARPWDDAPFGLVGLETTVGVVLTHLVTPGVITLTRAVALLSSNPARILGLPVGTLAAGSPADITVIDLAREWTVDPGTFESKARNTPFADWRLRGKAWATVVQGRVIMRDEILLV